MSTYPCNIQRIIHSFQLHIIDFVVCISNLDQSDHVQIFILMQSFSQTESTFDIQLHLFRSEVTMNAQTSASTILRSFSILNVRSHMLLTS